MVIGPGVEVKSVEGDALVTDRDLGEIGPDLRVEAVAVHAEILRSVAHADQAREDNGTG